MMRSFQTLLLVVWLSLLLPLVASEEQIKWTPNEDPDNAPLPLSMKQRQQLVELQQAIATSPDPQGTLAHVAQANGMSPQEMASMLEKNSRDLQQSPPLTQTNTVASVVSKVMASSLAFMLQSAKRHPRSFAFTVALMVVIFYSSITIPRTGMHVTHGTTVFPPNQRYLQKIVDSPALSSRSLSIRTKKTRWDDLVLDEDGEHVHSLPRSSELVQAVSCQLTLTPESLLDESSSEDEAEDLDRNDRVLELLFENAANLVSERQFAESPSEDNPLRVASSKRHGVLMVPGLGMFSRYGLIRWQVTHQLETDKDASVTLTSLKGDFFDGQIHLQVLKFRTKIVLMSHLVVPRRGRRLSNRLATRIVAQLVESLGKSVSERTRQNLARQLSGRRFKEESHAKAMERRKNRVEREIEIEEMAEDRRRKWQRGNPDAGRYTPSGHRQQSPNNC